MAAAAPSSFSSAAGGEVCECAPRESGRRGGQAGDEAPEPLQPRARLVLCASRGRAGARQRRRRRGSLCC